MAIRLSLPDRQSDRKRATLIHDTLYRDLAPVGLDSLFNDRQSQSCAAIAPGGAAIYLVKEVKNVGVLFGGDANALVEAYDERMRRMKSDSDNPRGDAPPE